MKSEVIKTSIGKIWLDEEGIIREKVHAGSVIDLDVAKEEIAAYAVLCKNEARPILVDIRNVKSVTREARSHLAGEEGTKVTRAVDGWWTTTNPTACAQGRQLDSQDCRHEEAANG